MQEQDITKRIISLRDDGMLSVARELDQELALFMKKLEDAEDFRERFMDHPDRQSIFHRKQAI